MASLRNLVESAVGSYLTGQSVGASVYSGVAATDKEAPCVIVRAESAEEDPSHSGNYRVTVGITIKATAESGSSFDTICDAVRDSICIDDASLQAALEAEESALSVWGASATRRMDWDVQEDCWLETQTVELYCAG